MREVMLNGLPLFLKEKKLLKILQISNKAPYPDNDGSSIAIYNMANGFIENGAELHLITINTKKHFKPDENVPAEFRRKSNYLSVFNNTDTDIAGAFANLFSSQSYFVSRFYFKAFEEAIIKKLKGVEFDVVQLEGLFVGVYLDAIKKNSKAKIVLRAHNVEFLIWQRHIANESSFLKRKYLKLQTNRLKSFELKIISEVDAVVSITDIDKAFIQKICPGKPVFTCITGVKVVDYKNTDGINVEPKTIFSFSSMDWMPNQEAVDWFLKNCWDRIHLAVPNCKFIIAGRNMPPRFQKLNSPGIEVMENVKNGRDFYNSHQIMLVPLLSGSGLRIKIIEGMAYGKAIVSTTIGAEGIKITSGKNILIADSPEEFSKAVIRLLQQPDKSKEIEKEARQFAEEEFDNKKVVSKLINFYKTLNA